MKASKGRETKIYLLIVGMKATPLRPHSASRVLDLWEHITHHAFLALSLCLHWGKKIKTKSMSFLHVSDFVSLSILYPPSVSLEPYSMLEVENVQQMVSLSQFFTHCLAGKATWNNFPSLLNTLFTFFFSPVASPVFKGQKSVSFSNCPNHCQIKL